MLKIIIRHTFLLNCFALFAGSVFAEDLKEKRINIFLAGDSTMAIKEVKDYPETGWGLPFSIFFDSGVSVFNHAKNGRSTRTFISEGRWQTVREKLQKDDIVIIQFGHNDEVPSKKDRYTTPAEYKDNLKLFVSETRSKGAEPILLSPVTRRYFGKNGRIKETHDYTKYCEELARREKVLYIDVDLLTRNHFSLMGEELSALRFMHIAADTHPNYPLGVNDNTHTNNFGAREIAQLVLAALKKRNHYLASRLRKPDPKHLKLK